MMKKIKQKSKKNNTKIQVGFTGQKLTNYAGILPVTELINKLEIGKMLDEKISLELGANIKYTTSQIILATVLGVLSGQNRINKIESFSQDVLVKQLLGIEKKLDEDTVANRFKKFNMRSSSEFMEVINEVSYKVHTKLGIAEDILDIDSSVRGVYGNQEGAQKGYNPVKKGQKSYHPLFGFLNSTKECLRCWLRPGDSYTSNNVVEFMKECLSNLPESMNRVIVRGDSGFFSGGLLDLLESDFVSTQTPYLIKVKMKNLSRLLDQQYWTDEPGSNFQSSVFEHKCHGWTKSRTFIALRRKNPPEEGTLFEIPKYEYFCYVSNLGLSPIDTHHCYGNRGESENWIEGVKNQLFGGCLLTHDFWCNEALWQCSILAYNISLWLRVLTDKKIWRQEPATFRSWFIQVAGKLVKTGRRLYLKIYEAYHYKTKWIEIYNRMQCLNFGKT
jgi:hypothetical protein